MLPKAKSVTTLSKSPINRGAGPETPIQYVKGVGPRMGAIFNSRDLHTVKDLLYFFPRAYEDRTRFCRVSDLQDGQKATVSVSVQGVRRIPIRKSGKSILEVRCGDESGSMALKWFHVPRGMDSRFFPGVQIVVTGTVKKYLGRPEIVHPEISWGSGADTEPLSGSEGPVAGGPNFGRVIPVYTEIEKVPTRVLRKILWQAIEKFLNTLTEDLPERFRKAHHLPALDESIRAIHFPDESQASKLEELVKFNTPAHWRLIYEEFFKFEYLVLRQRLQMEKEYAHAFGRSGGNQAAVQLEALLPFQLTRDQKTAVREILDDLCGSEKTVPLVNAGTHAGTYTHPMNRLIQGDVGSGKTAVSFLAAGAVLAEGGQAALMAPTEILAEQHYKNAVNMFHGKLNSALLTGKTPHAERTQILERLSAGEPILLIGTHALLEEPVQFKNLCFVMIDEQQRFGVEQRRTLRHKGTRQDTETGIPVYPHTLILSATPIPRTLALTAYGDLSVTTIRELPPGRTPVLTRVIQDRSQKADSYEQIRHEIRRGHQAYFIYPLVNDSEAEGFTQLKSAVAEAERLEREVFPEFKVGILHGQLKPEEKASVMDRFKNNELQILVSTTVVEVGVDVPNATVMAVEHAERFGLSQLHQLRGRVGRGGAQSYCYLFAAPWIGETSNARLDVLARSNDGFEIAEADLEIRGPGEFLGTRQAGGLAFKLGNLVRDREWLLKARDDAMQLLREDPELANPDHLPLRNFYQREGSLQFDRLKTS
ncbi:MAG TPA: ATP-dependent DNA helicase RecG [Bdellovibrionota bacterium]|nr:ATP-dependent DNA helicase RecG [Bdellovibrionota bacterium]